MASLQLLKGQRIKVVVEEIQPQHQMVVSFQGHLFRVINTSGRFFQKGDAMILLVLKTDPVELSVSVEKSFVRLA